MLYRLKFVAALGVALTLSLPAQAQDASTVVATVDGTEITLGHMIVAQQSLPEQYQQLPDEVLFEGILRQLIQQTALNDAYKGTLPPRVTLSIENETRSLIAGEMLESILALPIEEAEIRAAYDEQFSAQAPGEEYNASHILVETEEEAKAIKADLDGGADFVAIAREKSTGPSGPNGGALGWFGAGAMVPDFEAAVIALELGAVSDPVQTQFGWHVIKLNETRKLNAPEIDDVRDELLSKLREARVNEVIEELIDGAEVDSTPGDAIDPALLRDLSLLDPQ